MSLTAVVSSMADAQLRAGSTDTASSFRLVLPVWLYADAAQEAGGDADCVYPACLLGVQLTGGANSLLTFVLQPSNETGYVPLSILYAPLPSI